MLPPAMRDESPARRQFPETRWTLILAARDDPAARRDALHELLGDYWQPLYCFARRQGLDVEDARDAVQGFLTQLLARDFLARLDPAQGRFRAYLRTALHHFLANQHARAAAQKRGGGAAPIALDFDVAERHLDGAPRGPEAAFARAWALGVMRRALEALRAEFADGRRQGPFELVLAFFGAGEAPSYADAAAAHAMSEPQLKAFLHRARARFGALVRAEVARTVRDAGDVEDELRELLEALRA
jgi:RNA polymerase sigma-70 factor (ECF subfamily)